MYPLNAFRAAAAAGVATRPSIARTKSTMPPGFTARVGQLQTFVLPDHIDKTIPIHRALGESMVETLKKDGIFQISMTYRQRRLYQKANEANQAFFRRPVKEKAACVDELSYSGYIASGEEITDGIADYSEVFTVTKDLPLTDPRVVRGWPCHGPCPWPDEQMKTTIRRFMADLGENGEKLLQLIELGLGVPDDALTQYAADGWHHLRILRFPAAHKTNGRGKQGRGIGSHTDYGLLVIAAQDEVGGLFVRPPLRGKHIVDSTATTEAYKNDAEGWVYVPPEPGVFTVFPGDMLQHITNSVLLSTPHKVGLNTRERFAFAYFHEPAFTSMLKPLPGFKARAGKQAQGIHYGTHFTNMFCRNYPDRVTTRKLMEEERLTLLTTDELRAG